MISIRFTVAGMVLIVMAGCRTTPHGFTATAYQGKQQRPNVEQDASFMDRIPVYSTDVRQVTEPVECQFVQSADVSNQTLTLESLQAMAIAANPTIAQAQAQVDAARGAAYQAGLWLNPQGGYEGQFDRFGGAPNETWGGGFISQEIVTGGKLRLSRAKWCQRVKIAETNLLGQQQRVQNDVAIQFYRTLAAQRSLQIRSQLLSNSEDNLQTNREMLNLGQTNQPGLLRAEVELNRAQLNLRQAEYEFQHAWRLLQSIVNSPDLAMMPLVGSLDPIQPPVEWDSALADVIASSPEMIAAHQKVKHDRITVARERVEPIPNVTASFRHIENFDAAQGESSFTVGMPFPIFDRNRGTVRQAQADLANSSAEVTRLELELRNRLANQFRDYQFAWRKVVDFQQNMIPKARKSYDLLHQSYKDRRAAWPDVLMAQRMYLELQLEQVGNQLMFHQSDIAIRGQLLTGGLNQAVPPLNGGHVDAVAKPR